MNTRVLTHQSNLDLKYKLVMIIVLWIIVAIL